MSELTNSKRVATRGVNYVSRISSHMKQEREKSTAMRLTLYPLAEPVCKEPGGLGSWDLKKADLRGREKKASSCCLCSQFSGLPAVDAPPKRHTHSLQLPFSEGRHTEKLSLTSQGKQARKEKGLGPRGEGIIRMLQGLLDRDPGPITFPMRKGNRMFRPPSYQKPPTQTKAQLLETVSRATGKYCSEVRTESEQPVKCLPSQQDGQYHICTV